MRRPDHGDRIMARPDHRQAQNLKHKIWMVYGVCAAIHHHAGLTNCFQLGGKCPGNVDSLASGPGRLWLDHLNACGTACAAGQDVVRGGIEPLRAGKRP
jgi:hypothetical protein